MKISSGRMREYASSGPKLLPRTPVVVELVPRIDDASVFRGGKFLPEVLCSTASYLGDRGVVFGYTDYASCSLLLVDYADWESFGFRDPQELSSLAASYASIASCDKGIPFSSRSFNLPKDEVINYFIWKQMSLAGRLLRSSGLDPVPEAVNDLVVHGPSIGDPGGPGTWWLGRACNWVRAPQVDPETKKPIWFWDIDTETPVFSQSRDYINKFVYLH